MTSITFGLAHGLDNAAVALALGPLLGWRRGLVLAGLFALAEALMPLAGAAMAMNGVIGLPVPLLAIAATGAAGLALARRGGAAIVASTPAMAALALLLGLDNLLAGQASPSPSEALGTGLASAALSAAAAMAGAAAGARMSPRGRAGAAVVGLLCIALGSTLA